jgi:hypothetical protein
MYGYMDIYVNIYIHIYIYIPRSPRSDRSARSLKAVVEEGINVLILCIYGYKYVCLNMCVDVYEYMYRDV